MALSPKVQFKSIDKAGGIIQVIDATGAYSVDNPGGWGFPNASVGDMSKVILTLSQYTILNTYKQTYVRVADPLHPEWLLSPTLNQIVAGADMTITAVTLGLSEFIVPFEDGVFDLNMYNVLTTGKTGILAIQGNPFINGTGLDTYLQYDSILVGDNLYDIDKTKSTVGGTILYLAQELLTNDTVFYPCYRSNTKFMTDSATTACLYNKVGKLASCGGDKKVRENLSDIDLYQWGAQYAFDNADYVGASNLITAAQKMCEASNCGC